MDDEFMISVVVPCFNRPDLVGRAIKSALNQTYNNFEILVVDDASDDGDALALVIEKMNDSRIRLIRHKINKKGGAARNTGVREANGDFIAFLDSDDEWMCDKLEQQLNLFGNDLTRSFLVYTASQVITTQGNTKKVGTMPLRGILTNERMGDYLFLNRGFLPTPSIFLPRWLALEVPFNESLPRHQDYDFLLRLEDRGCEMKMCPEELVVVHWEDFHQTERGLNPNMSLLFIEDYQEYISKRACSGFVIHQIVLRLFRSGCRLKGALVFLKYVKPWHIGLLDLVSLFSMFVFCDARLAIGLAKVKRWVRSLNKSN